MRRYFLKKYVFAAVFLGFLLTFSLVNLFLGAETWEELLEDLGQVRSISDLEDWISDVDSETNEAMLLREDFIETYGYAQKLMGKREFNSFSVIQDDEGMLYYGRTHRHPNSTFTYTASSLMDLMTWDARNQVELINVPLLMMAGEKADSLYMTEEVFAKATGTKDKELFKIPGATHIQTYYVPEYVNQAVDKLKVFFGRTL